MMALVGISGNTINEWHVKVCFLGTVPAMTSAFIKKTHKLFLAMESWLNTVMTPANSVSANATWAGIC